MLVVFTGHNKFENHLQVTTDRDCLSPEITHFEDWHSTANLADRRDRSHLFFEWLRHCRFFCAVTGGTAYIDFGWVTWDSETGNIEYNINYEQQLSEGVRAV